MLTDRSRSIALVAALVLVVLLPAGATGQTEPPPCTIVGTSGIERIVGTPDADVICGLGGNDVLRGLAGNDVILGGAGNDRIQGHGGDDDLRGGPGVDVVAYAENQLRGPVQVSLADGIATGQGTDSLVGFENVWGTAFSDVLIGSIAPNRITGHGGNDTIRGRAGDDVLIGSEGDADLLAGDAGIDRCVDSDPGTVFLGCEP
jgi:hypothetical protein